MPAEPLAVTDDAALGGRLRLLQPRSGHRFGHDAILLAASVPARAGERAVDLGAGVGAAGLALAVRVHGVHVTLVEIDPALAALAADNIARNGLADYARAIALDIAAPDGSFADADLPPASVDHVLMNPPFNDPASMQASPHAGRRAAHVADLPLDRWIETAALLLRPGGMLTLIHRADAQDDILAALRGFGEAALLRVHPKLDAPPIRVIVQAVKGAAPREAAPRVLILNSEQDRPTAEAERILRDAAALTLVTG